MTYFLILSVTCAASLTSAWAIGMNRQDLNAKFFQVRSGQTVTIRGCSIGESEGVDVQVPKELVDVTYPWRYDGKQASLTEKAADLLSGYCVEFTLNPKDDTLVVCVGNS